MTWQFSNPNIAVTTNARDAKNSIAPFVAITYVGANNANGSAGTTSLTPVIHASAVSGDFMICFVVNNNTISTPAGWTLHTTNQASNHRTMMFYKFHTGAETNPTFNVTGTSAKASTLLVYRGVNTTTPINAQGTLYSTTSSPGAVIGPITGMTLNGGNALLVFGSDNAGGNASQPFNTLTGDGLTWTEIADLPKGPGGDPIGFVLNHTIRSTQSNVTVTNKTFSTSGSSSFGPGGTLGRMIELKTANP